MTQASASVLVQKPAGLDHSRLLTIDATEDALFRRWVATHKKVYADDGERAMRRDNFIKFVRRFNTESHRGSDGLPNSLADLTEAEFNTHYRTCGRGANVGTAGVKRGGEAEGRNLPVTSLVRFVCVCVCVCV